MILRSETVSSQNCSRTLFPSWSLARPSRTHCERASLQKQPRQRGRAASAIPATCSGHHIDADVQLKNAFVCRLCQVVCWFQQSADSSIITKGNSFQGVGGYARLFVCLFVPPYCKQLHFTCMVIGYKTVLLLWSQVVGDAIAPLQR